MKAASSNEIKQELKTLSQAKLVEICLRLARFKKDNKELLTFLLFESADIENYIAEAKAEMEESFSEINSSHLYYAKKSLRKILRITNKFIKYSGNKQVEAELLLHFLKQLKDSGIKYQKNTTLKNLYLGQLKKAAAAIAAMHEDLQYDYQRIYDEVAV